MDTGRAENPGEAGDQQEQQAIDTKPEEVVTPQKGANASLQGDLHISSPTDSISRAIACGIARFPCVSSPQGALKVTSDVMVTPDGDKSASRPTNNNADLNPEHPHIDGNFPMGPSESCLNTPTAGMSAQDQLQVGSFQRHTVDTHRRML